MTWLRLIPVGIGAILLIVLLYYRGEAIKAEAERDKLRDDLDTALTQNKEKDATIALLKEWKEKTDGLMTALTSKIEKLAAESQEIQDELTNLGKTDADAAKWLGTPVPDSVRRVLRGNKGDRKQHRIPVSARTGVLRHQGARPASER